MRSAIPSTMLPPAVASGDYEEKTIQMGRTREVLGWAPQARP